MKNTFNPLYYFDNPTDFFTMGQKLNSRGKMVALDIGEKKIGIAFSNNEMLLAIPHSVYKRVNIKIDTNYLKLLFEEHSVTGIIIGFPWKNSETLSNEHNAIGEKIKSFAKKLINKTHLPVIFEDEQYTTVIANSMLKELNMKRKKRNLIDDKIAAMIILDSFLTRLKNTK